MSAADTAVQPARLVGAVGHDVRPLVGEPATARRDDAGADVPADLEVARVRTAPLRENRDVQVLQLRGPPGRQVHGELHLTLGDEVPDGLVDNGRSGSLRAWAWDDQPGSLVAAA